jgi:hypothetical protein
MRSELRTEMTVRGSTRVPLSAARGATADASAGAASRGAGVGAAAGSVRGAAEVETTLAPAAMTVGPALFGAGTALAACCTTPWSGRAATRGAGAGEAEAGAAAAGVVGAGAGEAGAEVAGEVETTTVVDLRSVVVQAPAVVELDESAGAAGEVEEAAAAAGVLAEGAGAAGAVVELPPVLDDTFEPAGAAGGGGDACLAPVIVVSRGATMVVSRRAVAVFDALRTLSVGKAGEADRAVAKRTCSIIAE